MIKRLCCLLLSFLVLTLTACAPTVSERVLWHMDTAITVRLYGDADATEPALSAADDLLDTLDAQLSATDESSPIARFNASTDGRDVAFHKDTLALIEQALDISRATNGAFDITTAPLSALWQSSEDTDTLPTEQQLAAALALVGSEHLSLTDGTLTKDAPNVRIDLGGIGKGYACDRLLDELRATEGITAALISMGSNVAVLGEKPDGKPWRIALRDPNDATAALGYLHLTEGQVLSVSGDYERYFTIGGKHYSHILDPETGYPPTNGLRSVAVLCDSGATADALSTALLVMGEDAARALYENGALDFEAVFIYDGRVSCTPAIALNP
ncbi:MAG: FAD:protein FMN transferase [Clostridia bacterium]|nr:FAD:protein FMN transferase [Clostridia bacterium]